jgi:uncharacterized protein (DUF433 family)
MQPIEIHDRGRGPELKGTRITVYDVVPYRLAGRPPDYIAWALNITPPEVEALFRYMDEHYEEVMAVHWKIEERNARGNPPEVEEKLKASRAKLQAMLAERQRRLAERNGEGHPG